MKKLLVLDLDTGIDDAVALIHAVRSPRAQVLAVGTVGGNIDAERSALNTLKILDVLGVRIPVAVGVPEGLVHTRTRSTLVRGVDGLGDTEIPAPVSRPSGEHAVDQLIRLAKEHPGSEVRYLCSRQKDRGSDELLNWIRWMVEKEGALPAIPDFAYDMHTGEGKRMGRGPRYFYEVGSQIDPELPGRDQTYRERMLELIKDEEG